jgi:hypothetical protein
LNDDFSNSQGTYTPNEFSLDVSFARKFGENFSLGLTARYIHSSISSVSFATAGSGNRLGPAMLSLLTYQCFTKSRMA